MSAKDRTMSGCDAIVIGASSGGVEALLAILPALRKGIGVSVFVVLHMPRTRRSELASLFNSRCALPVREAEDKQPVVPGTVYFAPSDYHALIDRGPRIALSVDGPVNHSRPSIDVLFESAADIYAGRLLGVILTGANEDGAAGLAAIHRAGGQTMVQLPGSAVSPQMPAAALLRVPSSRVLTLADIAKVLHCLRPLQA
jgi:two-component system chemotaxis response regulator CheB